MSCCLDPTLLYVPSYRYPGLHATAAMLPGSPHWHSHRPRRAWRPNMDRLGLRCLAKPATSLSPSTSSFRLLLSPLVTLSPFISYLSSSFPLLFFSPLGLFSRSPVSRNGPAPRSSHVVTVNVVSKARRGRRQTDSRRGSRGQGKGVSPPHLVPQQNQTKTIQINKDCAPVETIILAACTPRL